MFMAKFYLTNAIPYVNGLPHLGHTLEFTISDVIARYRKLLGDDVKITCGSDENGQKILEAAKKAGIKPQALADQNTSAFEKHAQALNVNFDVWRRATDQKLHWPGVIELWNKAVKKGDIYKKSYTGLYCVGCEQFYTKNELVDGKCPEHLTVPEEVTEENYFFKLPRYQKQLEELITTDKLKDFPNLRKNEPLGFVRQGLQDFPISRPARRFGDWGIPVPDDPDQVMYVWFDALTIYMTAIGWNYDLKLWKKYWPADVHVIGKGIYRFHTVYWPAMLLSADLPLPKSVLVHGYITIEGQKMAKSLGNVVDPEPLINRFGADPIRYYLLKEIPTQSDGDYSEKRFKEVYNADLANGLGNLVSRLTTLCEKDKLSGIKPKAPEVKSAPLDNFELSLGLQALWEELRQIDKDVAKVKPWEKVAADRKKHLTGWLNQLYAIAYKLQIFLPDTADKIIAALTKAKIKKIKPLFPRL